jgi:hypothetical protein
VDESLIERFVMWRTGRFGSFWSVFSSMVLEC